MATGQSSLATELGCVSLKHYVEGAWGVGLPKFLAPFQEVHFRLIKGVSIFQNANNLNFKQFLGCMYRVDFFTGPSKKRLSATALGNSDT